MARVQRELGDRDRGASFVAVLALAWPDGDEALFRGEVAGQSDLAAARRAAASATTRCSCRRAATLTFGEMDPAAEAPHQPPRPRLRQAGRGLFRGRVNRHGAPPSRLRAGPSLPRMRGRRRGWGRARPSRSRSISIGRSAGRNARIATSTAMSASASTRRAGRAPCSPISTGRRRWRPTARSSRSSSAAARRR